MDMVSALAQLGLVPDSAKSEPTASPPSPPYAAAPRHPRELERLAQLHSYGILDTGPDAAFDNLIALAAEVTGTSMGAISFVDRERQWFKSTYGFEGKQTDRSVAFCAHAILEQVPSFVVQDAAAD